MKINLSSLNYFYILLSIIWIPLQKSIFVIDGAGRSLIFFTIITSLLNLSDKKSRRLIYSKPIIFWGIWVIYSICNSYLKGFHLEGSITNFFIFQLLLPYLVMLITARELIINKKKIIRFFIIVFLTHFILTFLAYGNKLFDPTLRSTDSFVNVLALNMIFLIFFSSLMYANRWFKLRHALVLTSLVLFIILLTQTRKALGASMIFIVFFLLSKVKFSLLNLFKTSIFSVSLYFGFIFLLNNSEIGERLTEIEEVGIKGNTTNYEWLNFLGDRILFYIEGWDLFLQNPFTGIGLTNFSYISDFEIVIHSEYMVQLTENGIIGVFLFMLFNVFIVKKLINSLNNTKLNSHLSLILLGGVTGILFINFTAWTYAFPQYFAVFGVIIGYNFLNKQKIIKTNIN